MTSVRATVRKALTTAGLEGATLNEAEEAVMGGLHNIATEWEDASSDYYYTNRHTSDMSYVAGVEDGWDHAAQLLRDVQMTPPLGAHG